VAEFGNGCDIRADRRVMVARPATPDRCRLPSPRVVVHNRDAETDPGQRHPPRNTVSAPREQFRIDAKSIPNCMGDGLTPEHDLKMPSGRINSPPSNSTSPPRTVSIKRPHGIVASAQARQPIEPPSSPVM